MKAAKAHIVSHANEWGIDPTQYHAMEAIDGVAGMSTVRFSQSIDGVEVANSLLAITVNKVGSLLSYTKSISDYSGPSQASINKTEAIESMKAKLANDLGITKDQVIVSDIKLVIVDGALVDNVPSGQYLAWRGSTSVLNDATSISTSYLSEDGQRVLSSLPFVR